MKTNINRYQAQGMYMYYQKLRVFFSSPATSLALLLVLDLGSKCEIPIAVQTRLVGLAARHHTAFICLTRKDAEVSSIGSLVSIRGEGTKKRSDFDRFAWEVTVLKDKQRGPGGRHEETCHGPDGLC